MKRINQIVSPFSVRQINPEWFNEHLDMFMQKDLNFNHRLLDSGMKSSSERMSSQNIVQTHLDLCNPMMTIAITGGKNDEIRCSRHVKSPSDQLFDLCSAF